MCPSIRSQNDHWVHCDRFCNVTNQIPKEFFESSLRVHGKIGPHGEFMVSLLQSTHWAYCGQIAEYILKEASMSGSGILWTHCRVLFEFDQKVIAGQIVIELMGTLQKRSQCTQ